MSIVPLQGSSDGWSDSEPSSADLAAIEAEWPEIEAGLLALDNEITQLITADRASELARRRTRRAERRLLAAARTTATAREVAS